MPSNDVESPLITVIIAVFNAAKTMQQCIDSVAHQTCPRKELIIIDGDSKDGTVQILQDNQQHIDYWISEPDSGIYNAWNKGLAKANGEWVCFLGADDFFWDDQVLEKMSIALGKVPQEIRLAYAQVMLLGADDEEMFAVGGPWSSLREGFLKGVCLPHQGVMHRKSLFEKDQMFDESFRIGGDYELLLRELKTADAFFIPDLILAAMRQGGLSSNPSDSIEAMLDIRRAQKMHGQYLPGFFWIRAMMRVYLKLFLWKIIGEQRTRKFLDFGRRVKGMPPYWTKT